MTDAELGKILARELFKVGDIGGDRCQRIEFKGGDWHGGKETALGGFGEEPLADWIANTLTRIKRAHSAPEQP